MTGRFLKKAPQKLSGNETVNAIIENCTAYISLVNCNDKIFLDECDVEKQDKED